MNIFTGIMLVFAVAGLADKTFSLKLGLTDSFDKGLATMGPMIIPIVSVCTVAVEFMQRHQEAISRAGEYLFFDPSLIAGALLAPDMGGYFIAKTITSSPEILVLNGVVVATLLGQAMTFQLPVFLAGLDRAEHASAIKGFIAGMIMIPTGIIAAEIMIRMEILMFIRQFVPILILCGLIAVGLAFCPSHLIKVFTIFGRIVQASLNILFFIACACVFVPGADYVSADTVESAVFIVFKSAVVISGALVMSQVILRFFRSKIRKLGEKIGVNEVSIIALLMNCATSLAVIPLYSRMDEKGKLINSAFAISGCFVLGGSLGFMSSVADGYTVAVFVVSKFVSGICSILLVSRLCKHAENDPL